MTWPTVKASNQYTDANTDLISNARADINQTILNVNTIIDNFDIASPTNGDLLQYNSTSGAWETVSSASVNPVRMAMFISLLTYDYSLVNPLANNSTEGKDRYNLRWETDATYTAYKDYDSIASVNATTGVFTLQAGRYLIEVYGKFGTVTGELDVDVTQAATNKVIDNRYAWMVNPSVATEYRTAQQAIESTNHLSVMKITKF